MNIEPNNIYLGDCLDLMAGIADESIDAIICDLPYQVLHKDNPNAQWDRMIPFQPLWAQYERIIKPNGAIILFAQGMFTSDLMQSNRKLWRYNLIWDKGRGTGFLNANRMPMRCHEDICVFYKQLPVYNPQMGIGEPNHSQGKLEHPRTNNCYGQFKTGRTYDYDKQIRKVAPTRPNEKFPQSIIHIQKEHETTVFHPTQKPVDLLRYLIRTYSQMGGGNFRQYDGKRHHMCSGHHGEKAVYRHRERPQVFQSCQKTHQRSKQTANIRFRDMKKDWTGGNASVFKGISASNHAESERVPQDYYATEPKATEWLLKLEKFDGPILEPACGEGHISKVLIGGGYFVTSRDIIDRGFGEVADFLAIDNQEWNGNIVTNPPYACAQQFVEKALAIIPEGKKVCMFLKLTFLEGKGRRHLFKTQPPARVWVSSSRLLCAPNGDFASVKGSAVAYAWFVWEKGYHGDTVIKWFN